MMVNAIANQTLLERNVMLVKINSILFPNAKVDVFLTKPTQVFLTTLKQLACSNMVSRVVKKGLAKETSILNLNAREKNFVKN